MNTQNKKIIPKIITQKEIAQASSVPVSPICSAFGFIVTNRYEQIS